MTDTPNWQILADALCDQTITPKQNEQLVRILETDDVVLEQFVRYIDLHAELQWQRRGQAEAQADWPAEELGDLSDLVDANITQATHDRTRRLIRRQRRSTWTTTVFLTAAALALAATLWILVQEPSTRATLVEASAAQWAGASPIVGEQLPDTQLDLQSGFAQIALASGVTVIIEGPAQFKIEGKNRFTLKRGKIAATVPPSGHGFVVATPQGRFVDLGTAFGIEVQPTQKTELHVFKGKVRIDGPTSQQVKAHEAFATSPGAPARAITYEPYRFFTHLPDAEELELRSRLGQNLVTNGDAESPGSSGTTVAGWVNNAAGMTLGSYDRAPNGPNDDALRFASPGPDDRGKNFFRGAPERAGQMSQVIDLKTLVPMIDQKRVFFQLSGWLGGWMKQKDMCTVYAEFLSEQNEILLKSQIGPITVNDRKAVTRLMRQTTSKRIPVGTRRVRIVVQSIRKDGKANDGYSDNLSLVLWTQPTDHTFSGTSP
jgi:hypothetical protein